MAAISRRGLLLGGLLLTAPAMALGGRAALTSPEESIAGYLRRQLPGLSIPDNDLQVFARQFLASSWQRSDSLRVRGVLFVLDNPWVGRLMPARLRQEATSYERGLMTDFLFSTDFFTEADEDPRRTRYIQYSDAYTLGCRNPLARLELETT